MSHRSSVDCLRITCLVWIAGMLAGGLGCGADRSSLSSSANEPVSSETSSQADKLVAKDSLVVVEAVSPVDDPAQQGWETEVVSSQVDKQLKQLSEVIETSPKSLPEFVSDSFTSPLLRPKSLETVFETDAISVRRWHPADDGRVEAERSEAFLPALRKLVAHVGDLQNVRTKTKVFGVELQQGEASTDLYFQLFGEHASGKLQVNTTWRCVWSTGKQLELQSIEPLAYEEVVTSGDASPLFADRTYAVLDGPVFQQQLQYGVDHWLDRVELARGIDIGGWQGLAIADVNQDGLDDLYVCQPGGLPNRLYVQNADGTATEVSQVAGVDWIESSHAALFVDLDNDSDQDLLVGVESGVLILSNDGRGNFKPRTSMVLPAALPYSLAAADVDVDGDLDAYVCCYNRRQGINRHLLFARPVPYHDADNGGRNVLLLNLATPVTGAWRFGYGTGRLGLDENNRKFSYAAAWEDYDNDGDLDLYVANDFGRNNLYQNQAGHFQDVAADAGVEDIGPGMSTCWGDYNNDGFVDLYVSNMFSSAGNRITQQQQFQQQADAATRSAFRRHARGNSLFSNLGDGRFEDVAVPAGVVLGRWAWGSKFADLNHDGWQDLIVTNGFITQEDSGDL